MATIAEALKTLIAKAGGSPPDTDNIADLIEAFAASYAGGSGTPANGSITSAMLANGAVTSDKIATNAVTADKIAEGAVTSAKIAAGVIPSGTPASGSITSDMQIGRASCRERV